LAEKILMMNNIPKTAWFGILVSMLIFTAGCLNSSGIRDIPGAPSIRDVAVLSTFHLRLQRALRVGDNGGQLDCRYIGILSYSSSLGAWPRIPDYLLLDWELYATDLGRNTGTNISRYVGAIGLESGTNAAALAVCEVNGVVFSIVYEDENEAGMIQMNLEQRHLPPLRDILAPLDMRRNGAFSRGGIGVTGWEK